MTRRFPFRLEIAGQIIAGTVELEAEADRGGLVAEPIAPRAAETTPPSEPVHIGRPSYDRILAEAVRSLGAELAARRLNRRERARRILKHLAQRCAPAEMPSRDTVERYLRGKKNCKTGCKTRRRGRSRSGG